MAQDPTLAVREREEQVRSTSHGRGGAGNINKRPINTGANPQDLATPTIKNDLYTTGRGGTGNMATNLKELPEIARAAQDVEAPEAHQKEAKGTYHWGRGGQGNMATVGMTREEEKRAQSKERNASKERATGKSTLEKGKEMLGLGGGKKKEAHNNAVEDEK